MSLARHGVTVVLALLIVLDLVPGSPSLPSQAHAATVPVGFLDVILASGLTNPTAMEFAPDGRLFVAEQGGNLRVIENGVLLPTPFLSVTTDTSGERGLLGVAFDPNFASNNFVYIYYTATLPAVHNRISRFTAAGDAAVPGSEVVLVNLENLSATNHNGGAIHFGPDGKLYAAVGENAVPANSQSLNNCLGKMLRFNTDGSIPGDNPFVGVSGACTAIWASGLRNPFTFAFQPGTSRMFINDVGSSGPSPFEEINDGLVKANYGWPNSEGPTTIAGETSPLFWYGHSGPDPVGCAIAGGAFYNPPLAFQQFPVSYVGNYFFADLCGGWIRVFDPEEGSSTLFAQGINQPVDLKVGPDGALYYLARGTGSVGRISTSQQLPGAATDVGVGAEGSAWVIGTNPTGGGFGIYRWTGVAWQGVAGGATRIAVAPDGQPWVVNSSGLIFRRMGTNWQQLPGAAIDIGIGADGSVWVVGTNAGVYQWNGANWVQVPGPASRRISVDPDGQPWVVNASGLIFRRVGTNWQQLPGAANDISVAPDGSVWVIGNNSIPPHGFGLFQWDDNTWHSIAGAGTQIALTPDGRPWIVNASSLIFRSN